MPTLLVLPSRTEPYGLCGHTLEYIKEMILGTDPFSGLPISLETAWDHAPLPPSTLVHEVCPRTCGALGVGRCSALTRDRCDDPTEETLGLIPMASELSLKDGTCSEFFGGAFINVLRNMDECSCHTERYYIHLVCTQTVGDIGKVFWRSPTWPASPFLPYVSPVSPLYSISHVQPTGQPAVHRLQRF